MIKQLRWLHLSIPIPHAAAHLSFRNGDDELCTSRSISATTRVQSREEGHSGRFPCERENNRQKLDEGVSSGVREGPVVANRTSKHNRTTKQKDCTVSARGEGLWRPHHFFKCSMFSSRMLSNEPSLGNTCTQSRSNMLRLATTRNECQHRTRSRSSWCRRHRQQAHLYPLIHEWPHQVYDEVLLRLRGRDRAISIHMRRWCFTRGDFQVTLLVKLCEQAIDPLHIDRLQTQAISHSESL